MFARVASAAVVGIEAAPIDVEVDVGIGLPCCAIVGLADAGIREGRVRIRGALDNSGFKLPPRRTTVNLAPADLRGVTLASRSQWQRACSCVSRPPR